MKPDTLPIALFDDEQNLSGLQFDEFRTKLCWAVNHVVRNRVDLATISGPFKEAVKHHQKMAEALAESIKFKSTLPMVQAFGPHWEDDLGRMQALYSKETR